MGIKLELKHYAQYHQLFDNDKVIIIRQSFWEYITLRLKTYNYDVFIR